MAVCLLDAGRGSIRISSRYVRTAVLRRVAAWLRVERRFAPVDALAGTRDGRLTVATGSGAPRERLTPAAAHGLPAASELCELRRSRAPFARAAPGSGPGTHTGATFGARRHCGVNSTKEVSMSTVDTEMVLGHFIVSDDVERSRRFYTDVLGGRAVVSGEGDDQVTYVVLANSWIIINVGGGPTDDKPNVTLETPTDPDRVSSFLNIRVADIHAAYAEWSGRGAHFLTPPKQHAAEIRCYIRDPDGYLIEVGQTTLARGWRPPS
jgi:catechol 2,3-dioxygenase-like lactoylglutathione lyase family enzyme